MTRPSGVRVVHADGTAALCELAATPRIDDNGDPVWTVLTVVDFAAG